FPVDGGDDLTVTGLDNPQDVVITDDGLHVYVAAADGDSVVVFGRDSTADPLVYRQTFTTVVPPTGDSVPGLRGARSLAFNGDERLLFVGGSESNAIAVFQRNADSGALTFIERVADGIGTIVPEFNVIRGVNGLFGSIDGNNLYSIAEDSEAVAIFSIDGPTNTLQFEQALRDGDLGLGNLAELQSITAAPGDTHLYVLSATGVQVFSRAVDGSLSFDGLFDQVPDLGQPQQLVIDQSGSRAYLLDQSAGESRIHVLRRDWNDGSLEFWFTEVIETGSVLDLLQDQSQRRILLAGSGTNLQSLDERALSRCLASMAMSDTLDTSVDLGVDGSSGFVVNATLHPSARGTSINMVTATPGSGIDPDDSNNMATVSAPIEVISDISVVKTGPTQAVAGTVINYQLVVANSGPSDALGIGVTDFVPAELSQVSWTCAASTGSSCPASGSDTLDFTADVMVNGQLIINLEGLIDPAFIGSLLNVALLTPEADATDPTPADQRAEWVTEVRAEADVAVSKTTVGTVVAGLPVQYVLTAVNNGPSNAPVVAIQDVLPAPLFNATWTCTGADGASCPAAGTGNPDFDANLPVGSSIEVQVSAELASIETGSLFNSVEAEVAAPVTDPDLSNNVADVNDTIEVQVDLVLQLIDPLDPFDPAGSGALPILATIQNMGPSVATAAQLALDFSDDAVVSGTGCSQPTSSSALCVLGDIIPNGAQPVELFLTNLPAAPGTFITDGEASSAGTELNPPDNSLSIDTTLANGVDLNVSLSNGRNWLEPGEPALWMLRVENIGSVSAGSVEVTLPADALLIDPLWTCTGTSGGTCTANGSGDLIDTASLPADGVVEYLFDGIVDPAVDLSSPQSVLMSALAETDPVSQDINAANNLAVDEDPVRLVMFEDGFETLAPIQQVLTPIVVDERGCFGAAMNSVPFGQHRLFQADASDGTPAVWLDSQVHAESAWVRMTSVASRRAESSGWRSVSLTAAVELRINARRAQLIVDNRQLWGASGRLIQLPAWLAQFNQGDRSVAQWARCGDSTAGGNP
ncbi:MAG: beta-propeller fold lactonase family protein, partial [Pseudomonadota bacterium]